MLDFSNGSDINKVPEDMENIAEAFYIAISKKCIVELRVEDLPEMDMDSILKTKIIEAKIDIENKCLHIKASELHIMFKYDSYSFGTQSTSHSKFYFESKGASLTVTVFM